MTKVVLFSDVQEIGFGRGAGVYRLATALRGAGFSTQVIDFYGSYTPEELFAIIDRWVDHDTLFCGFSTSHCQPVEYSKDVLEYRQRKVSKERTTGTVLSRKPDPRPYSHDVSLVSQLFARIRANNPSCRIVVGGSRTSLAQSLGLPVDYYVHGFADESIVALARHLSERTPLKLAQLNSIDSLSHYPVKDFSEVPIWYEEQDFIQPFESLQVELTRGCVFDCKFCTTPLRAKPRGAYEKSAKTLRSEFLRNHEKFGVTNYMLVDDTVNDSVQKLENLNAAVAGLPFKIRWNAYARVENLIIHPEMLDLMLASGAVSLIFGIETFSKKAGRLVGKGMDPERVKEGLFRMKEKAGDRLRLSSGFIIGLPEETEKDIQDTFDWLMRPDCPLDSWKLSAFSIRREGYPSFIGKNPGHFGYTFPHADPSHWESPWLTYHRAVEMAADFLQRSATRNKIGGFALMRLAGMGYGLEEVLNWNLATIYERHEEILTKYQALKQEYFRKIISK